MANALIESDELHMFLLSDGTRIDDNEYLNRLETTTKLIVRTKEQKDIHNLKKSLLCLKLV